MHAWRGELLAHSTTRGSQRAHRDLTLKPKGAKQIPCGYRNFTHYSVMALRNHSRIREDHLPTRIRPDVPGLLRIGHHSDVSITLTNVLATSRGRDPWPGII